MKKPAKGRNPTGTERKKNKHLKNAEKQEESFGRKPGFG